MYTKVKFIGVHAFYRSKFKGAQPETPEQKAKRLICRIPDGTVCEITQMDDNGKHCRVKYDNPANGKTEYLHLCLCCDRDKIELLEE